MNLRLVIVIGGNNIMTQYIPKDTLVAEIKSRISDIEMSQRAGLIKKRDAGKKIVLFKSILSLIDTLEVEEVEEDPVSEDLEEATSRYAKEEYSHKNHAALPDRCIGCYAPLKYAFKAGAKWQKEQMMKDAMYGLVCGHDESSPAWIDLNLLNKPNVKVGTEVKLIIIKDTVL